MEIPAKGVIVTHRNTLLLCPALVLALAPAAHADSMYTSASAFAAATTGDTAISFTAPSPTTYVNVGATYTDLGTGTKFTVGSGTIDVTGKNYYGSGTYSSDFLVGASDGFNSANTLTIKPPAGDSAFGFDIGGLFAAATFGITLSDGSTFSMSVPASYGTSFFGFTAPGAITSLSFSTPAHETFVITDAVVGQIATPEPSSVILLASVLVLGIGLIRRKWAEV